MAKTESATYSAKVTQVQYPKVKYFITIPAKAPETKKTLEDVTAKISQLKIVPIEGNTDGECWLKRLDEQGNEIWQTRHLSPKETRWHAEWEYDLKEDVWGS